METFRCTMDGITEDIVAQVPAEAAIRAARRIATKETRSVGKAAFDMLSMVDVRSEDGAVWQFTVAAVALLGAYQPPLMGTEHRPDFGTEEPS